MVGNLWGFFVDYKLFNEMKHIKLFCALLLITLFALSCGESNDVSDETKNEISDDYNLLVASDLGEIFEIGNNSGNIKNIGQIKKESSGSLLSTASLIASENKIYAVEYAYNPKPTNNLLIFDKQNGTTQIVPLTVPSNINGDEKHIFALAWNGGNLIGVLAENAFEKNSTKHLISINIQDNSMTDLGITFTEDKITSMKIINSKLYLSTWGEGLLVVGLDDKLITKVNTINGSRMALVNSSEMAIIQLDPNILSAVKPSLINLANLTSSDNSEEQNYGLVTVFGNSIYKNDMYLNLVSSYNLNLYLGILKTDFKKNKNAIVKINSTSVNRNLIILDTTN